MNALLVLPLLVPLVTAALCLGARRVEVRRAVGLTGAVVHLLAAIALVLVVEGRGIQVSRMGGWGSRFGIVLVADLLSAIMLVTTGVLGVAVEAYALASLDRAREERGFHANYHVLLMGVSGAFLTGDLFNLYVWFEVMLIASFVLIALGAERAQLEGALKYVTLNLLASMLLLTAVGLLYGKVGTLNMADVAVKVRGAPRAELSTSVTMLFLAAFGIKAAVFPLFFWLPASYPTAPVAVSAIVAGLLTKVGVYALIRTFTLVFVQDRAFTDQVLLVVAGFTMVTGVLGAAAQREMRRILSFHIVSQIGYMIMGLALGSRLALAGAIFFVVHNMIAKTALFLVSGVVHRIHGTSELDRIGGGYRDRWLVAAAFFVPAMALAGMPPSTGFVGKLALVRAGLEVGSWAIVAVALVVSILTLYSMTKIWIEGFWRDAPPDAQICPREEGSAERMLVPATALAALTVLLGALGQPLFSLSDRAAAQLVDPRPYLEAVLGPDDAALARTSGATAMRLAGEVRP